MGKCFFQLLVLLLLVHKTAAFDGSSFDWHDGPLDGGEGSHFDWFNGPLDGGEGSHFDWIDGPLDGGDGSNFDWHDGPLDGDTGTEAEGKGEENCKNTNNGAVDSYGDDCSYYIGSPWDCEDENSKTEHFDAEVMCCACGGGSQQNAIYGIMTFDTAKCSNLELNRVVLYEILSVHFHKTAGIDILKIDYPDIPSERQIDGETEKGGKKIGFEIDISTDGLQSLSKVSSIHDFESVKDIIRENIDCEDKSGIELSNFDTFAYESQVQGFISNDEDQLSLSSRRGRDQNIAVNNEESSRPKTGEDIIISNEISYRHLIGDVRDQGKYGTCVAFAADGMFQYFQKRDYDIVQEFSPKYFYYHRNPKDIRRKRPGMNPQHVHFVMERGGIVPETEYPYIDVRNDKGKNVIPENIKSMGLEYGQEHYEDAQKIYFCIEPNEHIASPEAFKLAVQSHLAIYGVGLISLPTYGTDCDFWNGIVLITKVKYGGITETQFEQKARRFRRAFRNTVDIEDARISIWSVKPFSQRGSSGVSVQWNIALSRWTKSEIKTVIDTLVSESFGTNLKDTTETTTGITITTIGVAVTSTLKERIARHSVNVYGYDENGLNLRNSWGAEWCENGHTSISWEHAWDRTLHVCFWKKPIDTVFVDRMDWTEVQVQTDCLVEKNIGYGPDDKESESVSDVSSLETCAHLCYQSSRCITWTYKSRTCYMKDKYRYEKKDEDGSISGLPCSKEGCAINAAVATETKCSCSGKICVADQFCYDEKCNDHPQCRVHNGEVVGEQCGCSNSICDADQFCYDGKCNDHPKCRVHHGEVTGKQCGCSDSTCNSNQYCYDGKCNDHPRCWHHNYVKIGKECGCSDSICNSNQYCYDGKCNNTRKVPCWATFVDNGRHAHGPRPAHKLRDFWYFEIYQYPWHKFVAVTISGRKIDHRYGFRPQYDSPKGVNNRNWPYYVRDIRFCPE